MTDDKPEAEPPPQAQDPPAASRTSSAVGYPGFVGTTVGRYEILAELGRGGMGIVYRARDPRLEREVALKFLPGFLTHDDTSTQRFIAEAKAASALDHPNICTIHEIGDLGDGRVFIAMAYYDGETISTKLQAGPLPFGAVLDFGFQVARGLAKAHAKNIVHRDIKPANLMVTRDGVVKILDFGTAKVGDLHLTLTGQMVGTLTYMSPEQLDGAPADARSDIWSVGALLYEMASGKPPFRGVHPAATLRSILGETPASLTEVASIPAEFAAVVGRCLEKDPANRYASADALAKDLELLARQAGVGITVTGSRPHFRLPPLGRGRRRWVAGAALAVAVALSAIPFTRTALLSIFSRGGERTYLAVIPFTPGDNVLAAGLTISLTSMIAQLGKATEDLWVVPASEVQRLAVGDARAAWSAFKAKMSVQGVVNPNGSVTLNLIETDGEASRLVDTGTLPDPNQPTFVAEARRVLTSFLDLRGAAAAGLPATEATVSAAAYPFYVRGLGYLERTYDRSALGLAETLFRQALKEDPAYSPAYAALCEALSEQYVWDRDLALARDAEAACDRAAALVDDDPSVLIPLAGVYLSRGGHDRATEVLQRALELEPDNAAAFRGLGKVYEDLGKTEEAERAYQRAITLRPDLWYHYDDLGMFFLLNGRPAEAAPLFARVGLLAPDNALADMMLGVARMQEDDFAQADSMLRRSIAKRPDAIAYRNLGHLYTLQLRFEDAIRVLETGLALTDTDWWSWRLLGEAHHFTGRQREAETAWRRARLLASERLTLNPADVEALSGLAEIHAALGEAETAQLYLARLRSLPLKWNVISFYTGRAYEMVGQRDAAISFLERALQQGLSTRWMEVDPWLGQLRQDPRYRVLLNRFSKR